MTELANDSTSGHEGCMCSHVAQAVAAGRNMRSPEETEPLKPIPAPVRPGAAPKPHHVGQSLTVFPVRRIITMDPGMPTATAVAVSDGRIVGVGSMKSLQPWLEAFPHSVDDSLRDKILLPGLIDPHLHPWLIAMLLTQTIVAPEAWDLPTGRVEAVTTREQLLTRLTDACEKHDDISEPLMAWGWNPYFHGPLTREDLNGIATELPVVVTHRSFHEVVVNDAAIQYFGLTPEALPESSLEHANFERGHFWERARWALLSLMAPHLFEPSRLRAGFELAKQLMHQGGVTTAADMLAGSGWDFDTEWQMIQETFDNDDTPMRLLLVPCPHMMQTQRSVPDETLAFIRTLPNLNTNRLIWMNAVKSFADGAFISQLMQLTFPGYIDSHEGSWITEPSELESILEPYWRDGFDVYHHVNGDLGLDVTLDVLERLRAACYRPDPIFDLHHFGISREDQIGRIARLGGTVSTNGYYLYLFGDRWSQVGVGHERASQMTRHGSLARHGVRFTMHSDCPMGPIKPLLAVQTAVTRTTASGAVLGLDQAVTLDQALAAVTIDAAASLRMDAEIGSIVAGKKADFTVLDEDPYEVQPAQLEKIPIWGTVFEGQIHKL